jgi:WD40 repeat protein
MDGCVRLWSFGPGWPVLDLQPPGPLGLAFQSADGTLVAAEQRDGLLRITDLAQPGRSPLLLRHAQPVAAGAFSPSGDRIATLTEASEVHLWDARQGTEFVPWKTPGRSLAWLRFDATGERFLTIGMGSGPTNAPRLHVWNARTLESVSVPLPDDRLLNHAEFSPGGRQVLTSSEKGVVRVWDLATQKQVEPAIELGSDAGYAHYSPDGKYLATVVVREGFEAGQAELWSVATHQPVGKPMSHEDGVPVSLFAPAGDRLATGGEDGTARIWSVPSGQLLTPPMPHDATPKRLVFTPDGSILATGTSVGQVRLWDAQTGNALMPSRVIPGGIASMAFAPAASEFIVVGLDGKVRRWSYAPALQPLAELDRLAEDLSGSQRDRVESTKPPR